MSGSGFPAGGPSTHGMPQQPGNGMIGANQAAAQTVGAPGGQGAQNWNQWFGEPAGGKVHLDPYEAYRRENFQLPEAYKGHNVYLTTVLIQLITEDDMWPARIALPFRVTENENTIVWDEIHFNNTLLNPVPEEGASRLVTQQTSERQDHYVRYGLAFMLEHGFMRTDKGRLCYTMNLRQIRNAVLETVYIGVLEAYLRCKTVNQQWQQTYGKRLTSVSSHRAMAGEVEQWAVVQKTEYGWDMLDSKCKKEMRLQGVNPDTWILPEGVMKYIAGVRKENFAYFMKGPDGQKMYDSQLNGQPGKQVATQNDCAIFETKSFEMPGVDEPVDVMRRRRTVGEYYTMSPHIGGSDLHTGRYGSSWRDIMIYDESRDGFRRIGLLESLDNCARFDPVSGALLPFAGLPGTAGDDPNDMFTTNLFGTKRMSYDSVDVTQTRPANYFGELNETALPAQAVSDWKGSIEGNINQSYPGGCAAMIEHLDIGLRLVRDLEDSVSGSDSMAQGAYYHYILKVNRAFNDPSVTPQPPKDPVTHFPELPLPGKSSCHGVFGPDDMAGAEWKNAKVPGESEGDGLTKVEYDKTPHALWAALFGDQYLAAPSELRQLQFVPVGYGNWPGLCILAKDAYQCYGRFHHQAKTFCGAVRFLFDHLDSVSHKNIFLDPARQESFFKRNDGINTFFSNLLNVVQPPLWMKSSTKPALYKLGEAVANQANGQIEGVNDPLRFAFWSRIMNELTGSPDSWDSAINNAPHYPSRLNNALAAVVSTASSKVNRVDPASYDPFDATKLMDAEDTLITETAAAFSGMVKRVGGQNIQTVLQVLRALAKLRFPEGEASDTEMQLMTLYSMIAAVNDCTTHAQLLTVLAALLEAERKQGTSNDKVDAFEDAVKSVKTNGTFDKDKAESKNMIAKLGSELVLDADEWFCTQLTGSQRMYDYFTSKAIPTFGKDKGTDKVNMDEAAITIGVDMREIGGSHGNPHNNAAAGVARSVRHVRSRVDFTFNDTTVSGNMMHTRPVGVAAGPQQTLPAAGELGGVRFSLDTSAGSRGDANQERMKYFPSSQQIDLSHNFTKRFEEFNELPDTLSRVISQAMLGVRMNKKALELFIRRNVVFPFGFVLFRPFMTYEMGTGILTVSGAETGETLVGHADFMLADNAIQKMHYGNFTLYLKSVVYKQQNVLLAEDIFAMGYVGGDDCNFFRTADDYRAYMSNYNPNKSLFACLVPYSTADFPNPMDITGRLPNDKVAANPTDNSLHYPSAPYYSRYWSFDNTGYTDGNSPHYTSSMGRINTICYQGHQAMYNMADSNYSLVVKNTGHWSDRVYPGCGKVRNGFNKALEPVSYNNVYGGGGSTSYTSLGY